MRLTYFTVAALYHKQVAGVTAGLVEARTVELVKPVTILAASEDAARNQLARMIPADSAEGAEALQNLDKVQTFVKRM